MNAFLSFALAYCISLAVGLTATAQPPLPEPVKVTTVEGITEYRLANGLRVLLFPDLSRSTITVNITYLVGSRHEGYGESGMAHLLEHMLFKGSAKHPNITQELTARGAQPNGTTWYDRTNYFETFAATEDNLRWALSLEADRMINSFIREEDLQSEFSVVRNEFEMGENDPEGILMERVMATAYLWHNYGKSTIGSKEDIENVPIENLRAFYRKYYQPDNAVLTITGKIDEAKTIKLVNEYFGPIPKPDRQLPKEYTREPTQDGQRMVELRRVGDVQVVSCGYHIPSGSHPDYVAVDVLTEILTDVPSGRLYKALVESQKATQVSGFALALKDPGYVYFSVQVPKDKSLQEAKDILLRVLDELGSNPITEEEVQRAKTKLLKDFELAYNNSATVGLTLSEFIAMGDWRLWFIYRDRLEQVTAEQVNEAAKAYFKPSNRTVGLFIPDPQPDRAVIPAPPHVAALVKHYKGKEPIQQGEDFEATCANIDRRTVSGKLSSGARYAFLSKKTRGASVNAVLVLRMGSEQTLRGKSAVAELTAQMLRRGTQSKTYEQLSDAIDKTKANLSISARGQAVTITVSTVRDSLIKTLLLIKEMLREPSFPPLEFTKLVEQELADLEEQRSDPQAVAILEYTRLLSPYPKGDFRYVGTFDEQVEALRAVTVDDIKKFYNDFYNGTYATISVVGDFDEAAVRQVLEETFKGWTSRHKFVRAPDLFVDVPAKEQRFHTPDKANAVLLAGYNLKLNDNHSDFPALEIGNFMLGGGFLNSRLAMRIRQKEGLSYGVGSWLRAGSWEPSGSFGMYAIYNPENADRLVAAFKEELDKILREGYTEAEFTDAVNGYLQNELVNRSRDALLAYELANNLYLNRTMKWTEDFENRIKALKVQDVNEAMRRWLKPEKISYILAGDFQKGSQ
ncbi:MAG: insulinase family protein [Chitinophagales bacterium]|nr:insulinase family protein [Chitinophagales bacterium]MDW8428471.1 pitrilysin family protein [Chitinophagales bacterium]